MKINIVKKNDGWHAIPDEGDDIYEGAPRPDKKTLRRDLELSYGLQGISPWYPDHRHRDYITIVVDD